MENQEGLPKQLLEQVYDATQILGKIVANGVCDDSKDDVPADNVEQKEDAVADVLDANNVKDECGGRVGNVQRDQEMQLIWLVVKGYRLLKKTE